MQSGMPTRSHASSSGREAPFFNVGLHLIREATTGWLESVWALPTVFANPRFATWRPWVSCVKATFVLTTALTNGELPKRR